MWLEKDILIFKGRYLTGTICVLLNMNKRLSHKRKWTWGKKKERFLSQIFKFNPGFCWDYTKRKKSNLPQIYFKIGKHSQLKMPFLEHLQNHYTLRVLFSYFSLFELKFPVLFCFVLFLSSMVLVNIYGLKMYNSFRQNKFSCDTSMLKQITSKTNTH